MSARDYSNDAGKAGQALVLFVMLNRGCSEEVAYQRIATFIKKQVLMDDHYLIDQMSAHDRQTLLETARTIFIHDPTGIDTI